MTQDDFISLIQSYGTTPSHWPDDRRAAGLRFLSDFPEDAKLLMGEDAALDEFLSAGNQSFDTELLKRRIAKKIAQTPQKVQPRTSPRWGAMAAMLAVSFTLGVLGGRSWPVGTPIEQEAVSEDVTQYAEAADTLGMTDIYEWVAGDEL